MVIEVKTAVAADLGKVWNHDCIELIIYCHYLMRLKNLRKILGSLTDGHVWHTFKFEGIATSRLILTGYTVLCNTDLRVVVANIQNLMKL